MIRIPCSGRITKSLLFKAFETGADGVALVGCPTGACRYGMETEGDPRDGEVSWKQTMDVYAFAPDPARRGPSFLEECALL